jgi:uncharacterized CHY-type Zn-finger protein
VFPHVYVLDFEESLILFEIRQELRPHPTWGGFFFRFGGNCRHTLELREYEPTTPLPLSSSKFNRGVRQMFEEMEISVK